jgi:putative flippase GtrA
MRKFYSFSLYLVNHRIARFLFSGGFATATNVILLFVLVRFFYMWYLLAAILSFIAAVVVSFMMQKFFTFNDYTKEKIKQQTVFYLGIQIFNLCLNTLLMYIGVDLLNIQYVLTQVLISSVMAVYNFFVYKYLVFTPDAVYTDNNQ